MRINIEKSPGFEENLNTLHSLLTLANDLDEVNTKLSGPNLNTQKRMTHYIKL
jgi:hypothetical protein